MKRADWKFKMVFCAVCGVVLIVLLLSGVTYFNFVGKSVKNNSKMVQLTFQEAEKNLTDMISLAERHLNRLAYDNLVYEFYENRFRDSLDESLVTRDIVQEFSAMIALNPNIYGVAVVSGEGRTIVSTSNGNRQGISDITDQLGTLLRQCSENYPSVEWIYYGNADIQENTPLHKLVQQPVILGIRAFGETEDPKEDVYLVIALDERAVESSYRAAAIFENSEAVLLDQNMKILSSTNEEEIGNNFVQKQGMQNIEYKLQFRDWRLVNLVPESVYFADAASILKLGLLLTTVAVLGLIAFLAVWLRKYIRPIQQLMERMKLVGEEQFDFPKPIPNGLKELDRLNTEFYQTVQKLKQYIQRVKKAEDEKRKEELKALQYQINPHFLANSLNSIRWMAILTNQNKVADSLAVLSKVFIPILRNPGLTWSLGDELEFLENYVEMMKIRYGDIIEYHLSCPEELYQQEFPRFILQPVIENCFIHRSESQDIQHIYLEIRKEDGFVVTVRNTGSWIDPKKLEQINQTIEGKETGNKSIGLVNIQKRLYYLYGEKGKISIDSNSELGVLVKITF